MHKCYFKLKMCIYKHNVTKKRETYDGEEHLVAKLSFAHSRAFQKMPGWSFTATETKSGFKVAGVDEVYCVFLPHKWSSGEYDNACSVWPTYRFQRAGGCQRR